MIVVVEFCFVAVDVVFVIAGFIGAMIMVVALDLLLLVLFLLLLLPCI